MSKSMLGGRGGSTITDAAVFRINKVKTTVLDFLGNVDIQSQKTIIDNNVESNNSIIQAKSSELIHIEEQLGSIQNYSFISDISNDISFTKNNLIDISSSIHIIQNYSFISDISSDISFTKDNLIDISSSINIIQNYSFISDISNDISFTKDNLIDISRNIYDISKIVIDISSSLMDLSSNYFTPIKNDLNDISRNINIIQQNSFDISNALGTNTIPRSGIYIDISNINTNIENILSDLSSDEITTSSNNNVKSIRSFLEDLYNNIDSFTDIDISKNENNFNIYNKVTIDISNFEYGTSDTSINILFQDYIDKIDSIYDSMILISTNNNTIKSSIGTIYTSNQENHDQAINIHDRVYNIDSSINNMFSLLGKIDNSINQIYENASEMIIDISKSFTQMTTIDLSLTTLDNSLNEEFTIIIDDINKSFTQMNTIDLSLTTLDNSLNEEFTIIIDNISKSFTQMNTIDLSLTTLDNSLNEVLNNQISSISIIDSSNEVIVQNNINITDAATTINTQYTVARGNIFAIDPLSV
jgi:hypothetical protein